MNDEMIIRLYWERNEQAIDATAEKYGGYLTSIAKNILKSREDAEECVNDTYLSAWNTIPPHRPNALAVFLGKITRNLSFNRYKRNTADKRGGGELPAVLDELAEIVSGAYVEREIDRKELAGAINAFLDSLSPKKRSIFVCRYWYNDSVSAIAAEYGMKENAVSMTLKRIRQDLHGYLTERGYEL